MNKKPMPMPTNPLMAYPTAFVATRLRQLADRISEQSMPVFAARGMDLDPKTVSILLFVGENCGTTIADAAHALGLSHQLSSQRVSKLIDKALVRTDFDQSDSRRRPLSLTRRGADAVSRLTPMLEQFERVFRGLFDEIGTDLSSAVVQALHALEQRPLPDRFE